MQVVWGGGGPSLGMLSWCDSCGQRIKGWERIRFYINDPPSVGIFMDRCREL